MFSYVHIAYFYVHISIRYASYLSKCVSYYSSTFLSFRSIHAQDLIYSTSVELFNDPALVGKTDEFAFGTLLI